MARQKIKRKIKFVLFTSNARMKYSHSIPIVAARDWNLYKKKIFFFFGWLSTWPSYIHAVFREYATNLHKNNFLRSFRPRCEMEYIWWKCVIRWMTTTMTAYVQIVPILWSACVRVRASVRACVVWRMPSKILFIGTKRWNGNRKCRIVTAEEWKLSYMRTPFVQCEWKKKNNTETKKQKQQKNK